MWQVVSGIGAIQVMAIWKRWHRNVGPAIEHKTNLIVRIEADPVSLAWQRALR
jgi:hypothetical protein